MKQIIVFITTLLCVLCVWTPSCEGGKINHVVVMMLENRAFDHMCGYLKRLNPDIDGLTGAEFNPVNPADKNSPIVNATDDAEYVIFDPDHGVVGTAYQTFGYLSGSDTYNATVPPMNGFVMDGLMRNSGSGKTVMKSFNPNTVPVISTLAQEFMIFDKWHASVPGPTEINRLFVHSATSHGLSQNDETVLIEGMPQKTLYQSLDEKNITWRIYMDQVTTVAVFASMRRPKYVEKLRFFPEFAAAAKSGNLPTYSFIEPRYSTETPSLLANDQHPSHDVIQGEKLIKEVYTTLRASPLWNSTALIITYDEHGGFYDHFPIPTTNVPNPDGIIAVDPPFHFTRLGVRIPTIIASPWIPKGYVEHEPKGPTPYSHYEHSSIPATMKKMFNLNSFLTKRDAWAGTFEHLFEMRDTPRTDCPLTLPDPPAFKPSKFIAREHKQPINDLQRGFVKLVEAVVAPLCEYKNVSSCQFDESRYSSESAAGTFMVRQMEKFIGRKRGY